MSPASNPRAFLGNVTIAAAALLFLQASAAGQSCGGGDHQYMKSSEGRPALPQQVRERYGWLYRPAFAKVELARLLPELNDPPEKLRAPFRVKDEMSFRLLIRNVSPESKSFILDSAYRYDRPGLYKDGVPMPYREDVLGKVRAADNLGGGDYARFERLRPGGEYTEIIKLGDWYKPLQPGRYELKMCRRFIWGGEWLETPPLAFDVVP